MSIDRISWPMDAAVQKAFAALPPSASKILLQVRERILAQSTANATIGPVTETLKWGQPSYLTEKTQAGSTLRLSTTKEDQKPAIFVHCQSGLADEIRDLYGDTLSVPDQRHVVLPHMMEDHAQTIDHVIALVLTHHARKRSKH
ncbi:MAG: hypothetical protein AAGI12_00145 [Pseudomonadota bacterium]